MLCLFCAYYSTDGTVNATIQRFTITLLDSIRSRIFLSDYFIIELGFIGISGGIGAENQPAVHKPAGDFALSN